MKALHLFALSALAVLMAACGAARPALAPVKPLQANLALSYRIDVVGGGHGSGAIISKSGHILTAEHVVAGHRRIGLAIDNGGPYPETHLADVVFGDKDTDLAVVKIERRFERTVWIGQPSDLRVALPIYSVGYSDMFGQFYHAGTVGALGFDIPAKDGERVPPSSRNLILCDLAITHGDSGGSIFSAETGYVIGFAHAIVRLRSGQTYALAQPVEKIRALLEEYEIPFNEP